MTVGELRKQIEGLDPKTTVAAYTENGDGTHFFDIVGVGLHAGTPLRHATGQAGFRFQHDGPEKWVLIYFEEA